MQESAKIICKFEFFFVSLQVELKNVTQIKQYLSQFCQPVMVVLGLLFTLSICADEVEYPCRDLITDGKYSQALTELQKQQVKSPDDYAIPFAQYKIFVTRNNPNRDIRKAYSFLCESQDKFNALSPKDQARVENAGYTSRLYASELANITLIAQLEAQKVNTLKAWDDFLDTYSRAPQKMIVQATKTRDALAFKQAEQTNTEEAYRQFVQSYPNAQERGEAEKRMYTLAYKAIIDNGSEEDYREYYQKYPNSPFVEKIRDRENELVMHREVQPRNWNTIRTYLLKHTESNRWRDTVMLYMVKYAQATHEIEATRWGIMNLRSPYSDSCWMVMRATCLEDTTLKNFVTFHNTYRTQAVERVHKADRWLVEAHDRLRLGDISVEQYIELVAPAYPAYYKLQGLIKADVKAKRWSEALATVKKFQKAFAGDKRYADLVRVMEEQDDPKLLTTSVGSGVNTPTGNEFSPVISGDGNQLYFCGTNRPGNIGNEDIFYSTKSQNGWSNATPVSELNTEGSNEAPLSLTTDGNTMIVFKDGKLMTSQRTKDGWGSLKPLSKNINISEWMADAMITSDGKALLFAAMCKVPHEHQMSVNIFVSLLQDDGQWGKPFGLGPQINTPRIDRSPFMHPDMKTLYFCSEGHGSLGGTDVFVSTRLDERSWTKWSEPVNMGKIINTAGNDCWYKISTDGALAYFSKRENKQNDIVQLTIPEKYRPQPIATITGKITDTQGAPVTTMIRWEDLGTQRLVGHTQTRPEDGSYFIVLPEGKNYGYYVYNDKLFPSSASIDLRDTKQFVNVENNITVTTIEEMVEQQKPIALNNLFFDTGKWVLLPASIAELNRVATIIRQQGKKVEISGHTDNVGDDESNRILSENRANAVRDYLVSVGIKSELLVPRGYGETRPVATNNTPSGRQKNRRVELKFIK